MMRQSGSRNQRPKGGFRLKLALQICLLLAICTWLLYQVKHSHDKKKALEDKKVASIEPHLFHFGRKGLPIAHQNDSISVNDDSEEGERDQDREMRQDEEFKRDGDDEEEEGGGEEEFFDEEEKDGRVEEDGFFDNKEGEESAQEAREENYKRDDASSAVAHDSAMEVEDSRANDDAVKTTNNETLGYVEDPISNVSNASFGENMRVSNAELSDRNELKLNNVTAESLPENNGSLAIQNGSKLNDSRIGSSGLIPAQDQNYRAEGRDLEDHHPLSSATKKEDEVKDLSAIPVMQSEVKDYDDNKAEG